MTPVYEVKTRHTDQVLLDFVSFSYKVKHPTATVSIYVFALCAYTIAYILRETSVSGVIVSILIGTIILGFGLTRKKIAASKLAKGDQNYKDQTEIHFVFGEKEMTIEDVDGKQTVKYGEIPFLYVDNAYYYMSVNNEVVHLLPKVGFVLGDAQKFYEFISDKTQKEIWPTKIPWKVRLQRAKEQQQKMDEERETARLARKNIKKK